MGYTQFSNYINDNINITMSGLNKNKGKNAIEEDKRIVQ